MTGISDWLGSFNNLPPVGILGSRCVDGICKRVMGGRSLFAKVKLEFSPSEELVFNSLLPEELYSYCQEEGWLSTICLGVLDVMLVRPVTPRTHFRCVIHSIEYHPIDSSGQAFRLAARYATEEFISGEQFLVI